MAFTHPIQKDSKTPAHIQVKNRILGMITDGVLHPGDKLPAEPDLAVDLGVSRMTANKAILALATEGWLVREKGRGTFVSARAERQILGRVAICIPVEPGPALDDHYFGTLYWSIQGSLMNRNVPVDVVRLTSDVKDIANSCSGVIAINAHEDSLEDLVALVRQGVPVVLLGASWGDFGFTYVDSDNLLGSSLAVNHLADLGHKRIAFIGGCPEASNTVDRVRGFQTAMKGRSLTVVDELVTKSGVEFTPADVAHIRNLLTSPNPPTAVYVGGAKLAMQVIGIAKQNSISIPEQLSLVAYDDPEFLKLQYPAVTTIRQPLEAMAEEACNLLIDRMRTADPRPMRLILDPTLEDRGTTCSIA